MLEQGGRCTWEGFLEEARPGRQCAGSWEHAWGHGLCGEQQQGRGRGQYLRDEEPAL